ncbi:MAG: DsbA family protein [Kofleriaceae bacterium]
MTVSGRLKAKVISAMLSPAGHRARAALARARGDGPLAYYFDPEDPWSYLGAQVLARLVAHYELPFEVHVVGRPASDVVTSLAQRDAYAVRDCQELAAYYDLDFPGRKTADPGLALRMASGLIRPLSAEDKLAAILQMSQGLWSGDARPVTAALGRTGAESTVAVAPHLAAAAAAQRKRGHYQGGMIWYRGEWYGAVDRVDALEATLSQQTGRALAGARRVRPEAERGPLRLATDKHKPTLALEVWFSYRSPYSYLALEQLPSILARYPAPLILRPIAPMVQRGHALVTAKRNYLLADAKRQADRLGVPFGEIYDPLGGGVDRCLEISERLMGADDADPAELLAFARSALRGVWAEGRALEEDAALRAVVERAGLPWHRVAGWLAEPTGAPRAANNALDLEAIGLWGVPAFRIGDLWLWGQDRLPLLEDRLRRHALAGAG